MPKRPAPQKAAPPISHAMRFRGLCLLLPLAFEKQAWGMPTFRAGEKGKMFAQIERHEGGRAACVPAGHAAQGALVSSQPDRYYVPSYVGVHGWVGIVLDDDTDWEQTAELVTDAYRIVATRRLAGQLDAPEFAPALLAEASIERAAELPPEPPDIDPELIAALGAMLREICLALPGVTEKPGDHPSFLVNNKTFAWFLVNHHGDRRLALQCKAAPGVQDMLVDAAPDRFFVPPFMGHLGWIGLRLEAGADPREVAALVRESYILTAPKRLLTQLDSSERG